MSRKSKANKKQAAANSSPQGSHQNHAAAMPSTAQQGQSNNATEARQGDLTPSKTASRTAQPTARAPAVDPFPLPECSCTARSRNERHESGCCFSLRAKRARAGKLKWPAIEVRFRMPPRSAMFDRKGDFSAKGAEFQSFNGMLAVAMGQHIGVECTSIRGMHPTDINDLIDAVMDREAVDQEAPVAAVPFRDPDDSDYESDDEDSDSGCSAERKVRSAREIVAEDFNWEDDEWQEILPTIVKEALEQIHACRRTRDQVDEVAEMTGWLSVRAREYDTW